MTKQAPAPPRRIDAWSYSRLGTYLECPAKAKYKYLDKLPEPGSDAMRKGSAIHAIAEEYVSGRLDPKLTPEELEAVKEFRPHWKSIFPKWKEHFDHAKKLFKRDLARVEDELAFTKTWEVTDWFAKGENAAWCRVKVDLLHIDDGALTIVDYKTGKEYASHEGQLRLYALAGMLIYHEDVTRVEARNWYLDSGAQMKFGLDVSPSTIRSLRAEWEAKTKAMLSDTRFAPTPSNACRWCHFRKSNGGPCRF